MGLLDSDRLYPLQAQTPRFARSDAVRGQLERCMASAALRPRARCACPGMSPTTAISLRERVRRFCAATTEARGFGGAVGLNKNRALCSIPARDNAARRSVCADPATLAATGRLREDAAHGVAHDLTCRLAKQACRP